MVPQYEFTKTIRFTLNGENTTFLLDKDINWQKTLNFNDFQISFNDLLNQFKKTVFYINNNGKLVVKNSLEIKKSWLRQYARDEFYKFNENQRKYNKFPAKLFQPIFNDWFKRNKSLLRQFEKINQMPQESQIKRSEILTLLQEIKIADNFLFIKNFVQPGIVNDKKSDYNLEDLKEKVNRFEELLNKAIFAMAPDLSQGAEVCRASLSYYTVNKISKRDFDKELEYKKQELKKPYNKELNQRLLKMVGFLDYLKSEYQSDIQNISIQNLYEALKQFKSQRKSEFMQAVQQGKQVKELIKDFPLFNAQKDSMQKFIYASKDKRGIYFQNQWGFPNYVNFCNNVFKPVAIKIGNLKAQIRAIEQEKIEARLLQYWAHILKKDNKYYLLLIPKEKMQEVKKFLNSLNFKKEREYTLYSFNSLTLRALKKLIRKNLGKEQIRLQNDNTAIALYKEVFQDKHPKLQNLDFSGFEKDIKKIIQENYNSEEDFRLELERVAYCCFEKKMNQKDIDLMRNKFSALLLEISAYDFERNIMGEMKEHSKIWQKFWTVENKNKNFPVRLNPEIRIFYRPQRQQGDPKKQKNRFAKDHFGVAFTITQNAAQKKLDLAFTKEKEISEAVKKFNKEVIGEFIKERDDNLYYYGIDRGQQELATLCVMRFSKEQGEIKLANGEVKKFDIPIPTPIKLYRIKENHLNGTKEIITDQNGKKKIVRILENPSYFIDEEEKFEEIKSTCFDLTTAKLIKNKIVLNGDVRTYIELKKTNGKRQLFEKLSKIDDNAKIEFCEDENGRRFQIKSKSTERNKYQYIVFYSPQDEKIMSREAMQRDLQEYLDYLRTNNLAKEDISIEKINHLRDAITANMVGIIAFLFKQYPGIINLENLTETHFEKNNENIERRLEWSLYKKFQKFRLVLPKLRQTVILRKEDNQLNQIGIIHFVSPQNTSSSCPVCGNVVPMGKREKDKFKYHIFICDKCGFNTQNPKSPFDFIKNSDEVAAYNIAKIQLK